MTVPLWPEYLRHPTGHHDLKKIKLITLSWISFLLTSRCLRDISISKPALPILKRILKDWNLLSKNKVLINRTFNDINQSNVISPIIKGRYSYLNFKKPALKNWKHIFSNIRNSQRTFDWFWSLKVLSIRSNHFLSERIFATLVPYVRRNISPVLTSKTHKKR